MKYGRMIVLLLSLTLSACLGQTAFPGAQGFGANSLGGRGGKVYKVTHLRDRGTGSLRAAVEAEGPRTVIFEVSGTIALQSNLSIKNPYLTIAGQTAPGDGICLKNYGIVVSADHVIIRYLKVRPGDNAGVELDGLWVADGQNIIIDHCSVSWGVDETLSASSSKATLGNVTVQWCMITESLNCSVHSKDCHGYGSLIRGGWGNGYSFHHNLYAHHRGRSPRPGNYNSHTIDPDGFTLDFRNNVLFNWNGSSAGYNADSDSITHMNFVGNHYLRGPNSTGTIAFYEYCLYSQAYFSNNSMDGQIPSNPWILVSFRDFSSRDAVNYKLDEPITVPAVTTDEPNQAYERVLATVGCSGLQRDEVDLRVLMDVMKKTGGLIDDEDEVGSWPELLADAAPEDTDNDGMPNDWELAMGLDPNDKNDGVLDSTGDGYTNLEEYLNYLCLGADLPDNDIIDNNDVNVAPLDPNLTDPHLRNLAGIYGERDTRQWPLDLEVVDLLATNMTRIIDSNIVQVGREDCVLAFEQQALHEQDTYDDVTSELSVEKIRFSDDQALLTGELVTTARLSENSNKLVTTQDIALLFQHTGHEWLVIYERLATTGQETLARYR